MTKINLLPDYIWEGKRRRQTWIIVCAALVVEAGLLGFFVMSNKQKLSELTSQKDDLNAQADAVTKIQTDANGIVSKIKPITDKTKYVEDILAYNVRFPSLFERTNMYTSSRVGYRQMQPAQTILNLSAYARSVGDIGRYLLNIQRAKDTFTTVSITSQMPGWSASGGTTSVASSAPGSSGPYGATGTSGPYGPAGSTGGPYGQGAAPGGYVTGSSQGGYAPSVAIGDASQTSNVPTMIEFTAVAQLSQKFQFNPPVYAGAGSTDTSGGATPYGSGGMPGAMPGGPGVGPGGGNGGGGNGGGGNGGGRS